MTYQSIIVVASILLPVTCSAATAELPNFEFVVERARENPSQAQSALKLLRAAAEQRTDQAVILAPTVGMSGEDLRSLTYTSREGRAAALYAIGKLRSPEALAYLEALSAEDFALAETSELWSVARIALYEARLDELGNSSEKARFLEDIVVSKDHDKFVRSRVVLWASEQLCNSGMLPSLHVVQGFLNEFEEPGRAQEQAQFCELRMRAIASNPDRVTALGSLIQVTDKLPDHNLIRWAIQSLSAMDDPRAIEPLQRYEREILALPQASPLRAPLLDYANEIRRLNSSRLAPVPHDPSRGYVIE